MKELFELIRARRQAPGIPHVVATVLRVEGSSYRRPGARMLMNMHGRIAGSISGGCLEKAVISESKRALIDGKPRLLAFDTTDQDDLAFGSSLGCQGKIWIGLEVLSSGVSWSLESSTDEIRRQRRPAALVTRIDGRDNSPELDSKLVFESHDEDIQDVLSRRKTRYVQIDEYRGQLIEWLIPPLSVVLFGAGPDVSPMLRICLELGHEVTVVDRRAEFAVAGNFPGAHRVLLAKPGEIRDNLIVDDYTVAVLMNHHYDTDRDVLASLVPLDLPYLAMLGPKKRTVRILDELRAEGHDVDRLSHSLHGPAGLDIGAETPEQIALSILAELQATLSRRNGGKLRERKAPIHADAFTHSETLCPVSA